MKLTCIFFQYYYNATTGQFMYWDGDRSTYLPAPSNCVEGMNEIKAGDKKGKEKEKKEKVKVAKKIAKVIVVASYYG